MRNTIFVLMVLAVFTNCKNSDKTSDKNVSVQNMKDRILHPGKKLMETNCYVCHNPTTGHDDRIAPPMIMVKEHYMSEGITKEQFVADIQNWIKKPSEDKTKMPGAIRNFGLMPYAPYPEATVEQIADFMFDYDIDKPEWLEKQQNGHKGQGKGMRHGQSANTNSNMGYADRGLKYALSTKGQLGKNLMGAIKKKGTKEAVVFCNERAYALTDSMETVNNANIKRVSDKPRNQNNKANEVELAHIETFKTMVSNQKEIEPIVEEEGDAVHFYLPITTNSMCLQCHGTLNKELNSDTYKTIKGLYPNDKAIGYDVNQIRGIWSITFFK